MINPKIYGELMESFYFISHIVKRIKIFKKYQECVYQVFYVKFLR